MLAIADDPDGLVTLTDLAATIGTAPSNVQKPLQALVEAQLLVDCPRGSDRRRFLLRRPSAAWDWARELSALVRPEPQTEYMTSSDTPAGTQEPQTNQRTSQITFTARPAGASVPLAMDQRPGHAGSLQRGTGEED
ncbi:MarR family transcriptional regulator [Segeticoccus rhizosphaerae]|uniref:MarR family transcriptional regulator n=1 Tax=Segeticoccus rhizosphaerae TaxID=1104777 RepID=UPI003B846785